VSGHPHKFTVYIREPIPIWLRRRRVVSATAHVFFSSWAAVDGTRRDLTNSKPLAEGEKEIDSPRRNSRCPFPQAMVPRFTMSASPTPIQPRSTPPFPLRHVTHYTVGLRQVNSQNWENPATILDFTRGAVSAFVPPTPTALTACLPTLGLSALE